MEIGLVSYTRALELRGSVTLANIVAYRGAVRYQKESSRVYKIKEKLHTKKVLSLVIRKL